MELIYVIFIYALYLDSMSGKPLEYTCTQLVMNLRLVNMSIEGLDYVYVPNCQILQLISLHSTHKIM